MCGAAASINCIHGGTAAKDVLGSTRTATTYCCKSAKKKAKRPKTTPMEQKTGTVTKKN
jgi:hypothetical protein